MRKTYYLAMVMALTAMVGCQNENELINLQSDEAKTFYATFENDADSRTALDDSNNVLWSEGDQLSVFGGTTANNSFILNEGAGTTYGTFVVNSAAAGTESSGSTTALSANAAYYPYDSNVTVSENSGSFTFNATFPATQTYSASGTFGQGASPMVAVTTSALDANLKFKNVGAIFRLQLKGDATITKVVFSADANLAGKVAITASNSATPTVNVTEGSKTITLDCGEGVELNNSTPTNFVVAMLPIENVTGGITITIYDKAGKKMVYTHKADEAITIERSKAYTTIEVTYEGSQTAITTQEALTSALSAAESGTPVVVDADIELTESLDIASDKELSLDLNGNTLIFKAGTASASTKAAAQTYSLTNAGTLVVENGKIVSTTDDYAVIYNTGTLTITNTTIETLYRGVLNDGTATLNCEIVSEKSNAVCNYNTGILNITGGTYESKLTDGGIAVRMGDESTDDAWTLTIRGGTFKAPWAALYLANNYYNLDSAGSANISGGTFEGGKADIGGAAVKNVTITSDCKLDVIKNLGNNPADFSCEMNGYNLQDAENHYDDVMLAGVFANGGEYTLTKDITLSETLTVAEGKKVTLNLGEYTLTSTDGYAAFVNKGTFELISATNGKLAASYRGVVNCGTLTLNCNITSQNSNAVCGYGDGTNIITIDGGTYTASETIKDASAVRMDPRKGGVNTGSAVDAAWQLTINGGTFVSKNWVALSMLDNYYELEEAGWAKINAGTFTGNSEYADIIGAAVKNITINTDACVLTNETIKNFSDNPADFSCEMNGYDLNDSENHYQDVKTAGL